MGDENVERIRLAAHWSNGCWPLIHGWCTACCGGRGGAGHNSVTVRLLIGLVVGLLLGGVCGFLKTNALLTLAPWAAAGLLIGYVAGDVRSALAPAALFGFVASLVYLLLGYDGSRPIYTILPFFVLASLFGAFCGASLGVGGAFARSRLFNRSRS